MGNDFDFICPKCNYNISQHKSKSYNPRKRITQLRLKRGKSLNRLLTKLIRLIKEKIPSENDTIKEYYFMKNIENVPDNIVTIGIHRYLEGHHQYSGKGFAYLSKIIEYTETNSERQFQIEQKRLGRLPKPQRKEDIDES